MDRELIRDGLDAGQGQRVLDVPVFRLDDDAPGVRDEPLIRTPAPSGPVFEPTIVKVNRFSIGGVFQYLHRPVFHQQRLFPTHFQDHRPLAAGRGEGAREAVQLRDLRGPFAVDANLRWRRDLPGFRDEVDAIAVNGRVSLPPCHFRSLPTR